MEYKSVSTKISRDEFTLLQEYCEKKGVTISSLIRDLLLKEMKILAPHNVAGKNKIEYNKEKDNFSWSVELDDGQTVNVLKNVSSRYLENLRENIVKILDERSNFINKKKKNSVAIPSNMVRIK